MNICCSIAGLSKADFPRQGIIDIADAGFSDIVIDLGIICPQYDLERVGLNDNTIAEKIIENPNLIRGYATQLFQLAETFGLSADYLKVPVLSPSTRRMELSPSIKVLSIELVKYATEAHCKNVIVPPLFADIEQSKLWEINKEFYLKLFQVAKEVATDDSVPFILLQNQYRDINGHPTRGLCSDEKVISQWIDDLNHTVGQDAFGLCVDVGVLNLCGQNIQEYINEVGSRAKAVIIRENDGNRDGSMLPFTMVSDGGLKLGWSNVIRGLREIDFDGSLLLEIKDSSIAIPPLFRPQFMKYAKKVVEFIMSQVRFEDSLKKYSSIVLFGAGNMCRNYMASYGEIYKPLYTCDNNSTKWGTKICGLEIKNPEILKKLLPEDVIIICNLYYRDIEKQLKDMGVNNHIEYFFDEYAPRLYVG